MQLTVQKVVFFDQDLRIGCRISSSFCNCHLPVSLGPDSLHTTYRDRGYGGLPGLFRPVSLHCDGQNRTDNFSDNCYDAAFKILQDLKSYRDRNSGFMGFCNTEGHRGFIS